MAWLGLYVGVAVAGLLVLGAVGFRLYRQVRQFARDIKAAGQRVSDAAEEMSRQTATRSTRA
jgi:hypothetical protein